ncbi:MAG: type II toxin-antitoxin system RelE/ParE family toxin [Rhodospirillales bacterium]
MSSSRVSHYRLSPKALADLDDVWRYTAERWSVDQADRYIDELVSVFETIVSVPALARERTEFTPPVRTHIHEEQLIVYAINGDHIAILRLLGGRQDWRSILKSLDP